MRLLTFTTAFLLSVFCASAQHTWTDHTRTGGVTVSVQETACPSGSPDQTLDYVFIRLKNANPYKVKASYRLEVYYGDHCAGCDGSPEYFVEVVLNPGETISGGCEQTHPIRLDVLVNNPNLQLGYKEFKITRLQVDRVD